MTIFSMGQTVDRKSMGHFNDFHKKGETRFAPVGRSLASTIVFASILFSFLQVAWSEMRLCLGVRTWD
jgi:hypothetical protein